MLFLAENNHFNCDECQSRCGLTFMCSVSVSKRRQKQLTGVALELFRLLASPARAGRELLRPRD